MAKKEWSDKKSSLTLTNGEWCRLEMYLLMSTNYRQGEYDACVSLSERLEPDGSLTFPNMPSNANFWKEMNEFIDDMLGRIRAR